MTVLMEVSAWRQNIAMHGDARSYEYGYNKGLPSPSLMTSDSKYMDRGDYGRPVQAPPSPATSQSSRPSLPSISSLLGYSLGKRDSSDMSIEPPPKRQLSDYAQISRHEPRAGWHSSTDYSTKASTIQLPPSPPLRPRSVNDRTLPSPPQFADRQSPTVDPHLDRHRNEPHHRTSSLDRTSHSTTTQSAGPYYASSAAAGSRPVPHHDVPYNSIPVAKSQPQPHSRSTTSSPVLESGGSRLWQHHHYLSETPQATFPPPQDRYVCNTCSKAFSRPSSLKIHCHSHTGEKPFKCPHTGCGKAFSVRSNMKRHERGCHAAIALTPAGMLAINRGKVPNRALQPAHC